LQKKKTTIMTITKNGSFTYSGSDNLIGFGSISDDIQNAGSGNDTLYGGAGNDSLSGNAGNDSLEGGAGNDSLSGGAGNDIVLGGTGDDFVEGNDGNDTLYGSLGNDTLFGETGSDTLYGETGDDTLYGGAGDDSLDGGAGNDTLIDSNGNDILFGGDGNDILSGGDSNNILDSNNLLDGGNGYDIATYSGAYSDYVTTVISDGAVQVIRKDRYSDKLFGIERITFANGAYDVYVGDAGDDNQTAAPNVWSLLSGRAGNDTLSGGAGNDTLSGDDGNDTLIGGLGNDTLTGGAGDDYLNGYGSTVTNDSQFDYLTGGTGWDTFVLGEKGKVFYNETGDGYAVIQDWHPATGGMDAEIDRVQLAGNASQYKVNFTSVNGIGSSAKDTQIFYKVGNNWERIGIIQDSTNFNFSRDARFV
jgi:Ca2+-binding RTX toxin-like protein